MSRYLKVVLGFLFVVLFFLAIAPEGGGAPTLKGTLSVSDGGRVYDDQLASWIRNIIPGDAKCLIVLTECYGGNTAGQFAGDTNTAVASATSPGELARYGGYDNDAAGALRPGVNRTGQTVHNTGTTGKAGTENPSSGGGLALGDFSLEDSAGGGNVQSRHVLVYAGQPDATGWDEAIRKGIKKSFAGKYNTDVRSVGGSGAAQGWDKPGTAKGLRDSLIDIGITILNAPDPSKEQFILFVTDHGDLHNVETVNAPVTNSGTVTITNFPSFTSNNLNSAYLEIPGFSVSIQSLTHTVNTNNYQPYFSPGHWWMKLSFGSDIDFTNPVVLTEFTELYDEYDNNIIETNASGEGVTLFFPVSKGQFASNFFDTTLNAMIYNFSGSNYTVASFSQDSGEVPKEADSGDSDGDRFQDLDEFVSGTDPTNSLSFLGLVGMNIENPGSETNMRMSFSWSSVSDIIYRVARSTNLMGGFSVIATNIFATPSVNIYTDSAPPSIKAFYRVGVE